MDDQTPNPGPAGNDETMPVNAQAEPEHAEPQPESEPSDTTTFAAAQPAPAPAAADAAPSAGRLRRFRDRSIKLWVAAVAMLAVLVLGGLSGAAIHATAANDGHGDRHGQVQRGERDGRDGFRHDERMPPGGVPAPPGGVPGTPPSTPPNETPDPEGSTDSSSGDAT